MSEKELKKSKTRQALYDMYLNALSEDKLPWEMRWSGGGPMHNPLTGTNYKGINKTLLNLVTYLEKYDDPRWATFNQIADKDGKYHKDQKWHLKKGSKGVQIENWKVWDKVNKKRINFSEYSKIVLTDPEFDPKQYAISVVTATVFNYSCVDGVPAYDEKKYQNVSIPNLDAFCNEVTDNMGVSVYHEGHSAYYVPSKDSIYLPEFSDFKTADDYYATRLHETAHATGAASRLNRDLSGGFGSESYAREELRAEMASSIIYADLRLPEYAKTLDSHKAYIQNWIQVLKEDPDELFRAFKDAEKISEYVLSQGPAALEKIRQEENESNEEFLKRNILFDQGNINISSNECKCLLDNMKDLESILENKMDAGFERTYDVYTELRDRILAEHDLRYIEKADEDLNIDLDEYYMTND